MTNPDPIDRLLAATRDVRAPGRLWTRIAAEARPQPSVWARAAAALLGAALLFGTYQGARMLTSSGPNDVRSNARDDVHVVLPALHATPAAANHLGLNRFGQDGGLLHVPEGRLLSALVRKENR